MQQASRSFIAQRAKKKTGIDEQHKHTTQKLINIEAKQHNNKWQNIVYKKEMEKA